MKDWLLLGYNKYKDEDEDEELEEGLLYNKIIVPPNTNTIGYPSGTSFQIEGLYCYYIMYFFIIFFIYYCITFDIK
jgi:hypothetical protein